MCVASEGSQAIHHEFSRLDHPVGSLHVRPGFMLTLSQNLGYGEQAKAEDGYCRQVEGERGEDESDGLQLFPRRESHRRRCVPVTPLRFQRHSHSGNCPASLDGALHMWQTSSNFVRPNMTIENAHVKGTETGSLVFSVDKQTVLTRGGDDTVKCESLWCCAASHPTDQLLQYGILGRSKNPLLCILA